MKALVLAGVLGTVAAGAAWAQEHPEHPTKKQESTQSTAIEATVTGENICVACAIQGAAAQCSKNGHQHALKVASATKDGKDLPEMKGSILFYLVTDNAQPLIKEHHAETVTLKAKIYPAERMLEVAQIEAAKKDHPEHPKKK